MLEIPKESEGNKSFASSKRLKSENLAPENVTPTSLPTLSLNRGRHIWGFPAEVISRFASILSREPFLGAEILVAK
jgi:hypothetical protein